MASLRAGTLSTYQHVFAAFLSLALFGAVIPHVRGQLTMDNVGSIEVHLGEHLDFVTEFDAKAGVSMRLTTREFCTSIGRGNAGQSRNMTVIFESQYYPRAEYWDGWSTTEIAEHLYSVSVQIPESGGDLWFWPVSNNTVTCPFAFALLPLGTNMVNYVPGGWWTASFSLNISSHLDTAIVSAGIGKDNYTLLNSTELEAGNRSLQFLVPANAVDSEGVIDIWAIENNSTQTIPVEVLLDGSHAKVDRYTRLRLHQAFRACPVSSTDWYGGTASIYSLNYVSPSQLTIRLDPEEREQVCFLEVEPHIVDFDAQVTSAFDRPFYQISLVLQGSGSCHVGLGVLDREWRDVQSVEDDSLVPSGMAQRYLLSTGSEDWGYIDEENQTVKLWASQLASQDMTSWQKCIVVFNNLTAHLHAPGNDSLNGVLPFEQELASAALVRGTGVCRHFARAYAAVLLDVDVPVRTIVGTLYAGNETWKKNHEWNEVYIGGLGWITVDVTWGELARLSSRHIQYTLWSLDGFQNITEVTNPVLDNSSTSVVDRLEEICIGKLAETKNLPAATFMVTKGLDEVVSLLGKARSEMVHGSLHSALLSLAEARALIDTIRNQIVEGYVLAAVTLIAGVILLKRHLNSRAPSQHEG
jgi:hypothetical protein